MKADISEAAKRDSIIIHHYDKKRSFSIRARVNGRGRAEDGQLAREEKPLMVLVMNNVFRHTANYINIQISNRLLFFNFHH